jgi:hypothetical protein
MSPSAFDVLMNLRLSIVRRAADMLVVHFGEIRPHSSGEGTVGDYALHVQCPWRFDGPGGAITGRDDLWEYAGPGERPGNWSYEDGSSLQDERLSHFFTRDERTCSWVNMRDRFRVIGAHQSERGEVTVNFAGGYALLIFPASHKHEARRLFAPGKNADHVIFPGE